MSTALGSRTDSSGGVGTLLRLPIDQVAPSPLNPRKRFTEAALQGLAASIRAVGVLQPIVVQELAPNSYRLVAGERRWRAARIAGLQDIPAVLLETDSSIEVQIATLVENLQRENLSPAEQARAFAALLETGLTQTQVGAAVGVHQSRVSHALRLLQLPDDVQSLLDEGTLSGGQGEALARWSDFPAFVTALAGYAVAEELTIKQLASINLHALRDAGGFDDVLAAVSNEVLDHANCAECPWGAFLELGATQGRWCFRTQHLREVALQLPQLAQAELTVSDGGKPLAQPAEAAAIAAQKYAAPHTQRGPDDFGEAIPRHLSSRGLGPLVFVLRPVAAVLPSAKPLLTPRQQEVLDLIVEGLTNRQIAGRLVVEPDTVKDHISDGILPRLGAVNRTQAAALATRRGLVA